MAFELGTIPRWAFADDTGRWNVGGLLYFYRGAAHDQPKTVYQDSDGTTPHTNPIVLDSIGSVGPIYFEDDEPYYIALTDSLGTLPPIWEFDNYVPRESAIAAEHDAEATNRNYVINGQFRFFQENPFSSLTASEIEIAPYWFFNKSNATATDTISFLPFVLGSDDPPYNPTYYCRYACTNIPTGETYKDFFIKVNDVNSFQNQVITISVEQRGTVPAQLFEFRYLQHFGTGGTPTADVAGAIEANNPTTDWSKVSATTTLPTIAGATLGTNGDDYVAIIIRMPLDAVTQFDFTNFQINLGDEVRVYEYQTYDKAKIEERSVNYPIYRDIYGLFTEQESGSPTTTITVNEGYCADAANNDIFRLRAPLSKDVTVIWTEGDTGGGLAESLTIAADTWYHIFLIFSPNGKVDWGTDTSISAANLLAGTAVQTAGYIFYRRVGSFRTNSSSLIKDYHQTYDTWLWDNPDNYTSSGFVAGPQSFVLDVPPGFRVESIVNLRAYPNAGTAWVYARPPFVADLQGNFSANPLYTYFYMISDSAGGMKTRIITNDSQQIRQEGSTAATVAYVIVTLGWKDWRVD